MNLITEKKDGGFKCTILADSCSPDNHRLTTMLITFPRMILAEFNTHRMFSRNSASSRAIPFKRMVDQVSRNPFIPIRFQKDHKGMQGSDYLEGDAQANAIHNWLVAKDNAVQQAIDLHEGDGVNKVTKQICNRLLEPFMWHTVCVSATEWDNFFALRAHEAAEIHMQKLAYLMLECYNASEPRLVEQGEWHIPFWTDDMRNLVIGDQVKVGVARIARTSYLNFDNERDFQKDIELHDRLAAAGHWSPFEQVATPDCTNPEIWGNFSGWCQYRKWFPNESRLDSRIETKELT